MNEGGRAWLRYLLWTAGACVVAAASMFVGAADLAEVSATSTVLSLRVTRAVAAGLAGAALGVGGVLVQGLFRNPLASPEIVGATAGASFGGHAALLIFEALLAGTAAQWIAPSMFVPLGCVAGALCALAAVLYVLRKRDDIVVVLVIGFLLSSLFFALDGVITSLAQERWELARAMLAITLGDVSAASPRQILLAVPLIALGIAAAILWAPPLDVLLSGEEEAASLGVHVPTLRRWVIAWVALLTAGAVALGGNVGFVGLVVPHALRRFVGVGHRALMPMAAIMGAAFVMGCDMLVRVIPTKSELPLGVVTSLIGAPVFFTLLMKLDLHGRYD